MEEQVASRFDRDKRRHQVRKIKIEHLGENISEDKLHNSYHIGFFPLACRLCGLQSLQENSLKKNVLSKKATGQNQVLLVWPHQEAAWPVQLDGSVPRVFEPRESGQVFWEALIVTWVTDVKVSY